MSFSRKASIAPLAAVALVGAGTAQESSAFFDSPVVAFDGEHRFERTLDLDGDGYEDAFGWYPVDNYYGKIRLRGYLNDGSGRLVQSFTKTVYGDYDNFTISESAVGDFDLDGRDDFVMSVVNELQVYRSNGGSSPSLLFETNTTNIVRGIAVGEFTGDAWPDIAVLRDYSPDELDLYENLGGTGFQLSATTPLPSNGHDTLLAAEVTGDGALDLVANDFGTLHFVPVSAGAFGTPVAWAHGATPAPVPALGDVDGDGDEDIVVFGKSLYALLRRTGPATWSLEPPAIGGPATGLADVDGDGDPDGVCCGSGGPTEVFNKADSKFEIAINDGSGVFAPSFEIQGVGSHHLAGAVDLEHDGDVDLVAGRCVYYSRGGIDGPLQYDLPLVPGQTGPSDRAVWDSDLDGDPDYVAGAGAQLLNQGDGACQTTPAHVTGGPAGLTYVGPGFPGDFDGDGTLDLFVSAEFEGSFVQIRMLAGNGGGGWTDAGAALPQGQDINQGTCVFCDPLHPDDPQMGFVHDFDEDGDLDIATVSPLNYTAGTTEFWQNDGTGTLTHWFDLSGDCVKAIADFDGDEIDDLWVARSSDQGFRRGLGGGLFGDYHSSGTGYDVIYLDQVAVADLDGDGDQDVATFDYIGVYSAQPIVLWNEGAGVFTEEVLDTLLTVTYDQDDDDPRRVWARDIDEDGLLDLVWGRMLYNNWPEHVGSIGVTLRSADNTSWLAPVFQIGDPATLADVDGDGDDDLLGDEIWFAARYEGPADGSRSQYGAGSAGTGGMHPTLGASGPFRVGEDVELRLSGAVGGGASLLFVSTAPAALPGWPVSDATLYVDLFGTLDWFWLTLPGQGPPGQSGSGGFTLSVTPNAPWVGIPFYHQTFTIDFGHPELVTASNGLELIYGL